MGHRAHVHKEKCYILGQWYWRPSWIFVLEQGQDRSIFLHKSVEGGLKGLENPSSPWVIASSLFQSY